MEMAQFLALATAKQGAKNALNNDQLVNQGTSFYGMVGAVVPFLVPITLVWVVPIMIIVMIIVMKAFGAKWWVGLLIGYFVAMPVTYYFLKKGSTVVAGVGKAFL